MKRLVVGLLLAACSANPPPPAAPSPVDASITRLGQSSEPRALARLKARRPQILAALAATILDAFERTDTAHPVFDCCIDWHSSVHAHWALLVLADALEDPTLRDRVVASLDPAGLKRERRLLADHPEFERPYGRAWFLRLAIAHGTQTSSTLLRPMATDVAASLEAHFDRAPPDPLAKEYDSAAWALAQLHDWYVYVGADDEAEATRARIRASFARPPASLSPARDAEDWPEFFSRWGVAGDALTRTVDAPTLREWIATTVERPGDLAPIVGIANDHHLGMNFSRAWSLCAMGKALGDDALMDRAAEHVLVAMARHEGARGDYLAYGHWVSQFGVYAMRCLFE